MIRKTILALLLAGAPLAPAAAVIAISAPVAVLRAAPPIPLPAPAPEPEAGLRFGELAAAGLGFIVLVLAFGTARNPHSVTS